MPIEHHDLAHELPELKDKIHELKTSDVHFRKLFNQYHALTREIENMESEIITVSTSTEETAKIRRIALKDKLYAMLKKADMVAS